jgi:hypothetical protein
LLAGGWSDPEARRKCVARLKRWRALGDSGISGGGGVLHLGGCSSSRECRNVCGTQTPRNSRGGRPFSTRSDHVYSRTTGPRLCDRPRSWAGSDPACGTRRYSNKHCGLGMPHIYNGRMYGRGGLLRSGRGCLR